MTPRMLQWARWPLWSWRNLVVTTLGVLVLLAAVGRVTSATPSTGGTPTGPAVAPAAVVTATSEPSASGLAILSSTPRTTVPSGAMITSQSAAPGATAVGDGAPAAAVRFVTAWARPDATSQVWLASLRPLTTAGFQLTLKTSDPGRVPASRVTGSPRARASSSGQLVSVPTDAGAVVVSVVRDGEAWKVADVAPGDLPPGAATPTLIGGGG